MLIFSNACLGIRINTDAMNTVCTNKEILGGCSLYAVIVRIYDTKSVATQAGFDLLQTSAPSKPVLENKIMFE